MDNYKCKDGEIDVHTLCRDVSSSGFHEITIMFL